MLEDNISTVREELSYILGEKTNLIEDHTHLEQDVFEDLRSLLYSAYDISIPDDCRSIQDIARYMEKLPEFS